MADSTDDNPLLAEILAEKASAYFATVRKMQAAVAALAKFDASCASPASMDANARRIRADLLGEAGEQVWYFVIQREAMKLPYYDEIFADFDIPEEVRLRMGPKNLGPSSPGK